MEHPALDSAREGLEKYLKGKSDAKFEITVKNAQGDNGTADTIAKQFVSEDVDLIYSIATNASQAAVNATGGTDIPVVFNAVTDGWSPAMRSRAAMLPASAMPHRWKSSWR